MVEEGRNIRQDTPGRSECSLYSLLTLTHITTGEEGLKDFYKSKTTSSCEYFHLVTVMVVVVVLVVRKAVREDLQLWEGQKLAMSEIAARLLLDDIKS